MTAAHVQFQTFIRNSHLIKGVFLKFRCVLNNSHCCQYESLIAPLGDFISQGRENRRVKKCKCDGTNVYKYTLLDLSLLVQVANVVNIAIRILPL